jgi:NADH dehydrogenase
MFAEPLASRATRDLENVGVQVWTNSKVTSIDAEGVSVGDERVTAKTVLWAAGVRASELGGQLGAVTDRSGRVTVREDLSIEGHPEIFVAGDLAHVIGAGGNALPGIAPVALQQGRYIGKTILDDLDGRVRKPFRYLDKGQMATIGRSRAIVEVGGLHLTGFVAWLAWLVIHIYYLSGFQNRLLVLIQWAWSYLTFSRGARLIVSKHWRSYPHDPQGKSPDT